MTILKTINNLKHITKIIISLDKFNKINEIQDTCKQLGINPQIVISIKEMNGIKIVGKNRLIN